MIARRTVGGILALALTCLMAGAGAHAAAEPVADRMAIGDTLRVTVFGRPDLTGEFLIGPDSTIRLPLVGAVAAAGRGREEIEQDLEKQLSQLLEHRADVTIDVAAYQPVFVIGDVSTPGEYPFSPDMTVLHAFAKAGGTPSLRQLPYSQALDLAIAQRDMNLAQVDVQALLIQSAAIDAALADTEMALPPELTPLARTPAVADLFEREAAVLAADRAKLETEIDLLHRQRNQFTDEVDALNGRLKALITQVEMIEAELSKIQGLADRGLATSSRLLELKRLRADVDSERYEAAAFLSRARQQMAELDTRINGARDDWRLKKIQERARVQAELGRARARVEGARAQMAALSQVGAAEFTAAGRSSIAFAVTRSGSGGATTVAAEGTTRLMPGDIVEVTVTPHWATAGAAAPTAAAAPGRLAER